jgi:hypothetical protein
LEPNGSLLISIFIFFASFSTQHAHALARKRICPHGDAELPVGGEKKRKRKQKKRVKEERKKGQKKERKRERG